MKKWRIVNASMSGGLAFCRTCMSLTFGFDSMSRMEKSIICSSYRKLSPKMYAGTIYLPAHQETIRVEKGQETSSSRVSMQSRLQYAYPDTGSLPARISPISTWEATRGKRALLCGVTYTKTKFKLRGSVSDVINMRDLLIDHFQFPCSSIHILAETEWHHLPTKKNIEEAMRWLVKDCQLGDSLVFYFSGHGLRQPDFDFDERDRFDETLCPLDFLTEGMIIDNEINDTIVRPLRKGVTLHAIVDTSHSGSILDLRSIYIPKDKLWVDNSPPSGCYKGTCGGIAISLAACEDYQSAQDTSAFSGSKRLQGAMTSTFVKAVKENPGVTYSDLLASMHKILAEARNEQSFSFSLRQRFTQGLKRQEQQEIQLSSSEKFDVCMTTFRL